MMDRTEQRNAQKELLTQIGQLVEKLGFGAKPSGQSFYRKVEGGKWAFHISFIPHKNDFDLTADIAIRVDEVENLVNKYDSSRTPDEKAKSMTIGCELGNLVSDRPIRWSISNAEEISGVSEAIVKRLNEIGVPFFKRHTDVGSVYVALKSEESKDLLLAPILGPRYMRTVASAFLLGIGGELDALVQKYEAKLREAEDLYLADYIELCRGIGTSKLEFPGQPLK